LIKELIMTTLRAPVILITDGLNGIGRAAAIAFAKKGAKVVVADRHDKAGEALVAELRSHGSEVEFIKADVRKEDDVRAVVDKSLARSGRLDVARNKTVAGCPVGPVTGQTAENEADLAAQVPHKVADAAVRAGDGMTAIVRLVYQRDPDSLDLSTLQFSLTAQQSLKLARDLLNRPNEHVRTVSSAGLERYRLLLLTGGTARPPEALKEVSIHASDVPAAIRQAFHVAWPPEAIGLILIDHDGREVFGRDNASPEQKLGE
jgi:NAD(P)-dependent dehydrogenase (short-subunit alcohol dehydrogenase family)